MSGPSSHPVERQPAAVVHGALDAPAPPDLAARALRRAGRDRGRGRVLVLGSVVVVVLAALGASRAGSDAGGTPGEVTRLDAGSVLSTEVVGRHVPGISLRAPATDVSPIGLTAGPGTTAVFGGWCGETRLVGVEEPAQAWAAEWIQQGVGGPGPEGGVREVVLRWPDPDGAASYARAVRTTPMECRDPRGAPYPSTTYTAQPPDGSPRLESPLPPLSLGVAPLTNGSSGIGVVAGDGVDGSRAGSVGQDRLLPAWRVRAVRADRETVVDLTVVLRSSSAAGAAAETYELLGEAVERTRADGPVP